MAGKENKNLPYDLENLSIPELEALLQQDFLASDGDSSDVEYIMAIVEVIHKKEQAQPDYQPLDTAKAWEEFQSFYNTQEGRENSIYRSDEEPEEKTVCSKTGKQTPSHKKSKVFRRCLLAAASLCLLVALTCVPVFGFHSIVQMLASWTAEQFGFYVPPEARPGAGQMPEEFAELQEILQQYDVELIIPKFPAGFEAKKPTLDYFPDDGTLDFTIMYQQKDDYYIFSVYKNEKYIENQYEKSIFLVETELYNGIEHFYLANEENNTVTWGVGTIEHSIVTNMPISDLEEIVEMMYEV